MNEDIARYKKALSEKIEEVSDGFLHVDKRYFGNVSPRAIESEAEKLGIDTTELYEEIVG